MLNFTLYCALIILLVEDGDTSIVTKFLEESETCEIVPAVRY